MAQASCSARVVNDHGANDMARRLLSRLRPGNGARFEEWSPALERGADAFGSAGLAVVFRNANARRNSAWSVGGRWRIAGGRPWVRPQFRCLNRYREKIGMPCCGDEADELDHDGNG